MSKSCKKYLFWFAQDNFATEIKQFIRAEIESIIKMLNVKINIQNENFTKPFWIVDSEIDEDVKQVAIRSFTMKYAIDLWAHGNSLSNFHTNLKSFVECQKNVGSDLSLQDSFKIHVETFNKKLTQSQKVEKIETLDYLPLNGPINLNNPQHTYCYIEFYNNSKDKEPSEIMFGRKIAKGSRDLIKKVSLKNRFFIGNTSLEPQLAFLMANHGLVQAGDLVYDPFVGTGSTLVSAALLGCYVIGSDIDYLTLHGKSKPSRKHCVLRQNKESVLANLKQYSCSNKYIDVVISDFSTKLWNHNFFLDAILTDPPYGIRESHERIGSKKPKKHFVLSEDAYHCPSTSAYDLQQLFSDLLKFSEKTLKPRGRLVCWFPDNKQNCGCSYPQSKNMKIVHSSEQKLNKNFSRHLLTYEKIK